MIAQIACHENSLPQGSPCSPVISNLIAHLLDIRLVKLASKAGCTYSRYADDLTFSTNKKEFPVDIAVPSGTDGAASHLWLPSKTLQKVIERTGFCINDKKTHMMYRTSRLDVTGLVVNKKINVYRYEFLGQPSECNQAAEVSANSRRTTAGARKPSRSISHCWL